jgi:methionine synthase II (cobalamin-independent)
MVEYFGERLEGYAFTERLGPEFRLPVREAPVLFGDVSRRGPIGRGNW